MTAISPKWANTCDTQQASMNRFKYIIFMRLPKDLHTFGWKFLPNFS